MLPEWHRSPVRKISCCLPTTRLRGIILTMRHSRLIDSGAIGKIDRINVYDGHQGPFEINCGKEFTDWLTDPVLNGGRAVIDFGCYGANLATRLMKDEKPLSVYAVLRQNKPNLYPKVDDDATIIVEYPSASSRSWDHGVGRWVEKICISMATKDISTKIHLRKCEFIPTERSAKK